MIIHIPKLKISIAINTNALDFGMMPIMVNIMSALQGEKLTKSSFEYLA